MRASYLAVATVALVLLFVGGFFAGAAIFKEEKRSTIEVIRSPPQDDGDKR